MTSSGMNGINIRTNASPEWYRTSSLIHEWRYVKYNTFLKITFVTFNDAYRFENCQIDVNVIMTTIDVITFQLLFMNTREYKNTKI